MKRGTRLTKRAIGYGEEAAHVAFECFAQPADQLLLVPQTVIDAIRATGAYRVAVRASSRTSSRFQDKTLEGFLVHTESRTQDPRLLGE